MVKDPDAVLDYGFDWGQKWLGDDTIASATWAVSTITDDAAPLTVDSTSNTTTVATVWLSGGTTGKRYTATCHIVTAAGREDERTLTIDVKER